MFYASTLADLLIIPLLTRLHDKLEVYDLCLVDLSVLHVIQRMAVTFVVGWLVSYNPLRLDDGLQCVAFMSRLPVARFSFLFAKRLCLAELMGRNVLL